jgi:hypothetical protein
MSLLSRREKSPVACCIRLLMIIGPCGFIRAWGGSRGLIKRVSWSQASDNEDDHEERNARGEESLGEIPPPPGRLARPGIPSSRKKSLFRSSPKLLLFRGFMPVFHLKSAIPSAYTL